MARKPLPTGYAHSFTQQYTKPLFARQPQATGQDLLKLSPVSQINKLVVQRFYGVWQAETQKLRSPYFNFEHEQVQAALKEFMNVLSRHIAVREAELAQLLSAAVQDAAQLALEPLSYFRQLAGTYPAATDFQQAIKYISWQPAMVKFLQEQSGSDAAQRVAALEGELQHNRLTADAPEPYLRQLDDACPLPAEFWQTETAATPPPEAENFFSNAWNEPSEPAGPSGGERKPPETRPNPPADDNPLAAEAAPAEVPTKPVSANPPLSAPAVAPKLSGSKEPERASLNDRFTGVGTAQPTLAEKLKKSSGSVRNHISLNQRFMFTKELFGGNTQAFNAALDELDHKNSLSEARQYLQKTVAPQYNWTEENEAVQEFQQVVEARFG